MVVKDACDSMFRIERQIDHTPSVVLPKSDKVCSVWPSGGPKWNTNGLTGGWQIHTDLHLRQIIWVNRMSSAVMPRYYAG